VDQDGNVYVAGVTFSLNFPLENPLQPNYGGGLVDAFVSKLNATGSDLVYSTYLGGGEHDFFQSLAVDAAGNAYASGGTVSHDFPTKNPAQPNHGGGILMVS